MKRPINPLPQCRVAKFASCTTVSTAWWRHQMETFSALLAICAGNSPVTSEFPTQRPVTQSFDVVFDLRLNERLCKHSRGWWFDTLSCPLWSHCNAFQSPNIPLEVPLPWLLMMVLKKQILLWYRFEQTQGWFLVYAQLLFTFGNRCSCEFGVRF